jgi:hypothetical protein
MPVCRAGLACRTSSNREGFNLTIITGGKTAAVRNITYKWEQEGNVDDSDAFEVGARLIEHEIHNMQKQYFFMTTVLLFGDK